MSKRRNQGSVLGVLSHALLVITGGLLLVSTGNSLAQAQASDGWTASVKPRQPAQPRPAQSAPIEPTPPVTAPGTALAPATAPTVSATPTVMAPPGPSATKGGMAGRADLSGDARRTRLSLDISAATAVSVFRMAHPFRVVIDLDDVEFRLPPGSGKQGRGLITAYRYGLFAPGKARVVIDTAGPVRVETANVSRQSDGSGHRLDVELVPTTAMELAAAELASAAHTIDVKPDEPSLAAVSKPVEKVTRTRPVVMIDPGHGGIDPGAQGAHGAEKDIVLAVSREIKRALVTLQRYEVLLTRSGDEFVSLNNRVRQSQRHRADLYISVHADSLAQKELAQAIRGATIYTLSEKASDERSRVLAEKENAADLLAGLKVTAAAADDQVRDILVDLMRRELHTFSSDFRGLLVSQLRPRLRLAKDPVRSAPFKVLRQPGSPAVLLELGYMSNAEDERQMASAEWQRGVGEAIAKAVAVYFERHPARAQP